jgi:hypothetical protein
MGRRARGDWRSAARGGACVRLHAPPCLGGRQALSSLVKPFNLKKTIYDPFTGNPAKSGHKKYLTTEWCLHTGPSRIGDCRRGGTGKYRRGGTLPEGEPGNLPRSGQSQSNRVKPLWGGSQEPDFRRVRRARSTRKQWLQATRCGGGSKPVKNKKKQKDSNPTWMSLGRRQMNNWRQDAARIPQSRDKMPALRR